MRTTRSPIGFSVANRTTKRCSDTALCHPTVDKILGVLRALGRELQRVQPVSCPYRRTPRRAAASVSGLTAFRP